MLYAFCVTVLIVTKKYATSVTFIVAFYESLWFKEIMWAYTRYEAVAVEARLHSFLNLGLFIELTPWPLHS
jgi:hypothetical protein